MIPSEFLRRIPKIFPPDRARAVERTFIERPTTFRVNTLKANTDQVLEALKRERFTVKRVPWSREAFILTNRSQRELSKLPLYAEGQIYLQSLASMLPPLLLAPRPGERVLDMTAAPGSKTSQIAALMQRQGALVACELDALRFEKLSHNMKLLGVESEAGTFLTLHRGNATKILTDGGCDDSFDRILLDAPCSAEARIVAKDRRTFSFWKIENIRARAAAQLALLRAGWRLLRPGGVLLYSTCTFAPEENEGVLSDFLSATVDAVVEPIAAYTGLTVLPGLAGWEERPFNPAVKGAIRILPTPEIEGFFIARLGKRHLRCDQ
ncbi:MAG: RsmB/NOP family class I SAM-dependent RNA methyltransferase [Proteobacteria bacterium]|nr:RsmB/NOP family class I SAM-dependent RNA methyltransferase [Pseudomonadota bacterium]